MIPVLGGVLRWAAGSAEAVVVAGGNGEGDRLDQLSVPCDVFVNGDGSVVVTDCGNARVVCWEAGANEGKVVAGGNGDGSGLHQLDCPCGVAVGKDGTVYISDCANHRIVSWTKGAKEGKIIAGGTRGSGLSQLSSPNGLALGCDGSVSIADIENHRVMRWAPHDTQGKVVVGSEEPGSGADQLDGPCGVCITRSGDVVVTERGSQVKDYRATRWTIGLPEGKTVAGGCGHGSGMEQLDCPWGVAETPGGGFVVVDSGNHRVVYWEAGKSAGVVVAGGNGRGAGLHQLKSPSGVALSCYSTSRT